MTIINVSDFIEDLDYVDKNWEDLAPKFLEFNYTLHPSQWAPVSKKIKQFYFGDDHFSKKNVLKLVQMFSDRFFLADAETSVRMQAKVAKSPVYYYIFTYPGDNNDNKSMSLNFLKKNYDSNFSCYAWC